jgi:hypothetical protein
MAGGARNGWDARLLVLRGQRVDTTRPSFEGVPGGAQSRLLLGTGVAAMPKARQEGSLVTPTPPRAARSQRFTEPDEAPGVAMADHPEYRLARVSKYAGGCFPGRSRVDRLCRGRLGGSRISSEPRRRGRQRCAGSSARSRASRCGQRSDRRPFDRIAPIERAPIAGQSGGGGNRTRARFHSRIGSSGCHRSTPYPLVI